MTTKEQLKTYFERNDRPTQEQFVELIDACYNELVPVIPEGSNLFNIVDVANQQGFFVLQTNGTLSANSNHSASHFVEVEPEVNYYFSTVERFAWYDADQNFISGESIGRTSTTRVAPIGARYVRFSIGLLLSHSLWQEMILSPVYSGATSLPFSQFNGPYTPAIPASSVAGVLQDRVTVGELAETVAGIDEAIVSSDNLFNRDDPEVLVDTFISHLTGAVIGGNDLYYLTHPIEVEGGLNYYVSSRHRWAWYDSNNAFISGSNVNGAGIVLTAPPNAAYLRFSFNKPEIDILMVAQSNEAVNFEPFGFNFSSPEIEANQTSMIKMLANLTSVTSWTTPTNVLYIGDSFWNDAVDIAQRSIFHSGVPGNRSLSVAGSTLTQIPSILQGFDTSPFDTVVIGRATNDVLGGIPFNVLRDRMLHVIGLFGDKQLVVTKLPPLSARPDYNAALQAVIDEFNEWLDTLWVNNNSRRVFDIYSVLDADDDNGLDAPYQLAADNIHPNAAGSDAAGAVLATLLTS